MRGGRFGTGMNTFMSVHRQTLEADHAERARMRAHAMENAPSLQPSWGVQDRKTHLLRAAGSLARQRLAKNLQRIDRAADRMAGRKRDGLGR